MVEQVKTLELADFNMIYAYSKQITQHKRGGNVVKLDEYKQILTSYEDPLKELRDSL